MSIWTNIMQVETFAFLGKSYVSKIETPCCSILFPNLETNKIYIWQGMQQPPYKIVWFNFSILIFKQMNNS